jgi:16S rRNA G966 N2-methylase RsmD
VQGKEIEENTKNRKMLIKLEQIIHTPHEYGEDEIGPIKDSISKMGLIHPISVRESQNGNFELIAGGKRLTAFRQLNKPEIEAMVFPSGMSQEQCKEISLHENLRRANLSWADIVQQEKELHELRVSQKGQRPQGGAGHGVKSGWSLRDTADELGIAIGNLSQDIMLANAIAANPHLAKVKDKSTALRLIKAAAKNELAMQDAQAPTDDSWDELYLGDSLDILPNLRAELFDVCITDPPWSEYKEEFLTQDMNTMPVFKEVYRLLKHDAFLYCILSTTDFPKYQAYLSGLGFTVMKYPIIWHKKGVLSHGTRAWEYMRDYEVILLAVKGSPALTTHSITSSIIQTGTVHASAMIHPNEKPKELIAKLLQDCSHVGSKVLDPFAGSGVVADTAKDLNRRYITIERDKSFYNKIKKRLNAEKN